MAKNELTPLVLRAQKGDPEALNGLLEQCYEKLFYYAYNTVKNEDLAADITQESCMEIIRTLDKLRNPEAFLLWASRIVSHKCVDYYRQNKNEVLLEENEDGETILDRLPDESRGSLPEQVQEDKEFRKIMWQMLDSLPEEQRQALLLYYFENLSVGQIAEIQGKSEGTIKSRLNYGRKAVIAQVEAYEKKTGVRLHSLAPLPLLLYFLFWENQTAVLEGAAATVQSVWSGVSAAAAGGATAATTGVTAVTTAGGVAAATAGTTAGATAIGTGIAVKITAGIAAIAVAVGAVAGGIALSKKEPVKEEHEETPESVFSEFVGQWTCIPVDQSEDGLADVTEPMTIEDDGTFEYLGETYQLRILESGDSYHAMAASHADMDIPDSDELTEDDVYELWVTDYDDGKITRLSQVYTNEYESYPEQIACFYRESDYQDYTKVILTEENVLDYLRIDSFSFGLEPVEGQDTATAFAHYLISFDFYLGTASYCRVLPTVEYLLEEAVFIRGEDSEEFVRYMDSTNLGTLQIRYEECNTIGNGLCLIDNGVSYEDTVSLNDYGSAVTQITSNARLVGAEDVYGVVFVPNDQSAWNRHHAHDFTYFYVIDSDTHQGVCCCGQTAELEEHTYENYICTVCHQRQSSQGLEYTLRGDCYAVTGIGTCTDTEVCIPSCYQGLPVSYIAQNAFRDCQTITSVVIPSSVHTIEQWAFMSCENLSAVHFSQGLRKIENLAFIWCTSLREIILPDTVVEMGHSVFNECTALEYVALSENMQELEHGMFSNCDNLSAVYIPVGITQIGDRAFWHCTNLTDILYEGTMEQWTHVRKLHENTWEKDFTTWCSDTGDFTVSCEDGVLAKADAQ